MTLKRRRQQMTPRSSDWQHGNLGHHLCSSCGLCQLLHLRGTCFCVHGRCHFLMRVKIHLSTETRQYPIWEHTGSGKSLCPHKTLQTCKFGPLKLILPQMQTLSVSFNLPTVYRVLLCKSVRACHASMINHEVISL